MGEIKGARGRRRFLRQCRAPSRWPGRWPALGVVLAFVVIGVGCGSSDSESGTQDDSGSGELQEATLRLNFLPEGTNAPYFYAAEQGYYEEEGLDLTIQDGKGSLLTAQDVDAGNATFGRVGTTSMMQASAEGADLVSVATDAGKNSFGLIVPEDSPIETVTDLEGEEVIVSTGSPETIFLPASLRANDVDPASVKETSVDPAAKLSVYSQGRADVVGTAIAFGLPVVDAERPSRGILFADNGAPFPDYSLVVSRETVESDPDLVAGFLRATFRGYAAAVENPEATVEAVVEARPQSDKEDLLGQFEESQQFYCSPGQSGEPVGYNSPEEYEAATELLEKYGDIDTDINPSDLYTNEFFESPYDVSEEECP